jgi:hypothetical protein
LPGFSRFSGSKPSFTSSKAATSRGPNIRSWNSEREMPSPCSPECEPSKRRTRSQAASAIARIARTPPSSFMLRMGRTWRQPTEAWAYQVPTVPWRANSSVTASV